MFKDRMDAGHKLALLLEEYRLSRPLALALPRGGVVVGAAVARELKCELDVLLVKKLRAPDNPELALGAVGEGGQSYLNNEIVRMLNVDQAYIDREIKERCLEMQRQRDLYRKAKPRISPAGRTTILVDDGLATGATMIAAVQTTAVARPQQLIVAVPISSIEAKDMLETMEQVDRVVCLSTPEWFGGVGQFYEDFAQVSDEEVIEILQKFS
jgi:putative phosphoribosyl transferase